MRSFLMKTYNIVLVNIHILINHKERIILYHWIPRACYNLPASDSDTSIFLVCIYVRIALHNKIYVTLNFLF